jgi:hypothetical protein
MEDDTVLKHLRSALNEIISTEKTRLHEFYNETDDRIAKGIEKMVPLIKSLKILKQEIGEVDGLRIHTAPHGHMATVEIEDSVCSHFMSISTSLDNTQFEIEEKKYLSLGEFEEHEKEYYFDEPSEVLKFIMEPIGKHIASKQVLDERKSK